MPRRREFSVFNLSFLDVMSCGFGAVVLVFMIISAQVSVRADKESVELLAETNRLEEEILDGRKNLVRLRTTTDQRKQRMSDLEEEARRLQARIAELEEKLSELDENALASLQSVEELEADIERLEAAREQLLTQIAEEESEGAGSRVRAFVGDGNRQYLTGMKMGGKRILILVDASASMLGRTYVNAIIYRNLPDSLKLRAPKWRSAVGAVDWITTRLPRGSEFQIVAFNAEAWSVVDESNGDWVQVVDTDRLDGAVAALRKTVPGSGTSLHKAFDFINGMQRKPDNVYLLTDGLPTQGKSTPSKEQLVKPASRMRFFGQAADRLPGGIPINVMLFPMDGDPNAAGLFWRLAIDTRGSFMTPSRDWP